MLHAAHLRGAMMSCCFTGLLLSCRAASGEESAIVLAPLAAAAGEAAVPHLAPAAPASLRSAISQLLTTLTRLDADALWLLLFRLADQVNWHQCCFALVSVDWQSFPGTS